MARKESDVKILRSRTDPGPKYSDCLRSFFLNMNPSHLPCMYKVPFERHAKESLVECSGNYHPFDQIMDAIDELNILTRNDTARSGDAVDSYGCSSEGSTDRESGKQNRRRKLPTTLCSHRDKDFSPWHSCELCSEEYPDVRRLITPSLDSLHLLKGKLNKRKQARQSTNYYNNELQPSWNIHTQKEEIQLHKYSAGSQHGSACMYPGSQNSPMPLAKSLSDESAGTSSGATGPGVSSKESLAASHSSKEDSSSSLSEKDKALAPAKLAAQSSSSGNSSRGNKFEKHSGPKSATNLPRHSGAASFTATPFPLLLVGGNTRPIGVSFQHYGGDATSYMAKYRKDYTYHNLDSALHNSRYDNSHSDGIQPLPKANVECKDVRDGACIRPMISVAKLSFDNSSHLRTTNPLPPKIVKQRANACRGDPNPPGPVSPVRSLTRTSMTSSMSSVTLTNSAAVTPAPTPTSPDELGALERWIPASPTSDTSIHGNVTPANRYSKGIISLNPSPQPKSTKSVQDRRGPFFNLSGVDGSSTRVYPTTSGVGELCNLPCNEWGYFVNPGFSPVVSRSRPSIPSNARGRVCPTAVEMPVHVIRPQRNIRSALVSLYRKKQEKLERDNRRDREDHANESPPNHEDTAH